MQYSRCEYVFNATKYFESRLHNINFK